jgi:V/A-type H+/Na+-transporting ATPase subunit E
MKGKEAIVARIVSDAQAEANEIVREAETKAGETIARHKSQAQEMIEAFGGDIEDKTREVRDRRISVGRLDMRKKMLSAKQGLIDDAFSGALTMVKKMPDSEYRDIITGLVLDAAEGVDEEIIFGEKDPHKLGEAFVKELNGKLTKGSLTLGAPSADFETGCILKRGGRETNCTMAAVLKNIRERIEPEVAARLFEET